jgi:hypothetical protein
MRKKKLMVNILINNGADKTIKDFNGENYFTYV